MTRRAIAASSCRRSIRRIATAYVSLAARQSLRRSLRTWTAVDSRVAVVSIIGSLLFATAKALQTRGLAAHKRVARRAPASGRDERQLDEARPAGRVVNALHGLPVIGGLGPEDVRHERLRVPVVEREPAPLDLHHDA